MARPVRVPGRPLEVVGDDGPREMILPHFGGDRTRLIPRAHTAPEAVITPGRRDFFESLTCPDAGANVGALAPVAQLDRASPSGGEGHRFESCRAHSKMTKPRTDYVLVEEAVLLPLLPQVLAGDAQDLC